MQGSLENRGVVYANWFDDDGIRYAVPVNGDKPNTRLTAYALLNQPFGKRKISHSVLQGNSE